MLISLEKLYIRGGAGTFAAKVSPIEEVERQVKVPIKHLAIFFLLPSKKLLLISFKIQLLEISPQKEKEQRQKQMSLFSDVFSLPVHLVFLAIYSYR
jgi:hypothetical protein